MSGFPGTAETFPISRKKRFVRLVFILVLVSLGGLGIEHWRGERALRSWKERMVAHGEIFEPTKLWPAPIPAAREFSNQLATAVKELPKSLHPFAGTLSGVRRDQVGRFSRGSQQARPPFTYAQNDRGTWQELELGSREAQPALEAMRKLMKSPPRALDTPIVTRLDYDGFPNLSSTRRCAQALHASALLNLHRGELAAALEDLEALQGCVGMYADDLTLISYMIRVGVVGLANDACWDALQETRWTEAQLRRLVQSCQGNDLFPQIPGVMAGERLARIHSINWFATHSYQEWIDRYAEIHKSFGSKAPELDTANWNGLWRKCVFHPAWSFAWRAQDELGYLQFSQRDMEIVREGVKRGSWDYLKAKEKELRKDYRRPPADWRFYRSLPLHDILGEIVGAKRMERPECPYLDVSMAWFIAGKNLTRHEMVQAVIALKLYKLREGKLPRDLASLVPGYLAKMPRDLMDGRPLRYRLNADGSFVLYSVGKDVQDNGGDGRRSESGSAAEAADPWEGRDWVWGQAEERTRG